jgi:phosphomethylpyrimidine synthase
MRQEQITTAPFPNSRKVFISGNIHPIKVAMREIQLSPTKMRNGVVEMNPPVTVYDTSGPYTDVHADIDVRNGLPRIREQWILDRGDVDILPDFSSEYGKERLADKKLDHLRFDYRS